MNVCASIALPTNGRGPTVKPTAKTTAKTRSIFSRAIDVDKIVFAKTFLEEGELFETISKPTTETKLVAKPVCGNGFLSTVHCAFANELPVAFTPSQIWTLILQAVSIHVNENAEEMRDIFVDHEGQKTLLVRMDHLQNLGGGNSADAWAMAFPKFIDKLASSIKDPSIASLMTDRYASGTDIDEVTFAIAMMDATKQFFKFRVITMCGITAVHLLGQASEWTEVRERAAQLCAKLGLDWWSVELLPVLDQFVQLASGNCTNVTFWQHMYRDLEETGSGAEYSGFGWINVFFPYKKQQGDSSFQRRCVYPNGIPFLKEENTLEKMRVNLSSPDFFTKNRMKNGYLTTSQIAYPDYPSGANKCPFIWEFPALQVSHDMRFCSGFLNCIGVQTIEGAGGSMCIPVQGWAVVCHEQNTDDPEAMNPVKK